MIGVGWAPDKTVAMTQGPIVPLGVMHDFTSMPNSGTVSIGVTEERKASVAEYITECLLKGAATYADCASLMGKCRFVFCPSFGKVGLGALQPLNSQRVSLPLGPGSPGHAALVHLRQLVRSVRPAEFSMRPGTRAPVVLITDAFFQRGQWLHRSGLGIVVYDMETHVLYGARGEVTGVFQRWADGG